MKCKGINIMFLNHFLANRKSKAPNYTFNIVMPGIFRRVIYTVYKVQMKLQVVGTYKN